MCYRNRVFTLYSRIPRLTDRNSARWDYSKLRCTARTAYHKHHSTCTRLLNDVFCSQESHLIKCSLNMHLMRCLPMRLCMQLRLSFSFLVGGVGVLVKSHNGGIARSLWEIEQPRAIDSPKHKPGGMVPPHTSYCPHLASPSLSRFQRPLREIEIQLV